MSRLHPRKPIKSKFMAFTPTRQCRAACCAPPCPPAAPRPALLTPPHPAPPPSSRTPVYHIEGVPARGQRAHKGDEQDDDGGVEAVGQTHGGVAPEGALLVLGQQGIQVAEHAPQVDGGRADGEELVKLAGREHRLRGRAAPQQTRDGRPGQGRRILVVPAAQHGVWLRESRRTRTGASAESRLGRRCRVAALGSPPSLCVPIRGEGPLPSSCPSALPAPGLGASSGAEGLQGSSTSAQPLPEPRSRAALPSSLLPLRRSLPLSTPAPGRPFGDSAVVTARPTPAVRQPLRR